VAPPVAVAAKRAQPSQKGLVGQGTTGLAEHGDVVQGNRQGATRQVKGLCLVLIIEYQLRWTNMCLYEIQRRLVHK